MTAPISAPVADLSAGRSAMPARPGGNGETLASLKEKATAFESMYLAKMLEPLWEGIETDGPFGGGAGEDAWRGLLIQEYANTVSARGGIGLADSLVRHLLTTQEVPHA